MIKDAIGTGNSIDEAKEVAIKELMAPEGVEIKYEVVEQPKKKTLGIFGGTLAKVRVYYEIEDDKFADVKAYINKILVSLGVETAEISVEVENGEEVHINISCEEDYGSVIGRRGETLDAIQYLTRLVLNRNFDEFKRVSVNIGNYREKREATLRSLAKKNAAKVKKYGRNVVLEPMNPYERRIIHTAIHDIEGVTSHSVGSEDDHKVVITLEEGYKPTNGGYSKGRGGYNKNRGSGRSSAPAETQAPAREPRSDSAGTLYGKIEI